MSIKSWRAEFYTEYAADVPAHLAVAHSIKKWKGLTHQNLAAHGLERQGGMLTDGLRSFHVTAETCALCEVYLIKERSCGYCPIHLTRGAPCDSSKDSQTYSPFHEFVLKGNPQPMLEALYAAEAYELQQAEMTFNPDQDQQ